MWPYANSRYNDNSSRLRVRITRPFWTGTGGKRSHHPKQEARQWCLNRSTAIGVGCELLQQTDSKSVLSSHPQYGCDYWKAEEYQPWHLYKHATGNQIAKTSAIKTRLLVCLFRYQYPLKTAPITAAIGKQQRLPGQWGRWIGQGGQRANLVLWDSLLFPEQLVNFCGAGHNQISLGKRSVAQTCPGQCHSLAFSLDIHPEVQARKLPEKPFSYKLFSLLLKTSINHKITFNQNCACCSLWVVQSIRHTFPTNNDKRLFCLSIYLKV